MMMLENISLIGALEVLLYVEANPPDTPEEFRILNETLSAGPAEVLSYPDAAINKNAFEVAPNETKSLAVAGREGSN